MSETAVATRTESAGTSLVARMAQRFAVEPNKMLSTLKATAFRGEVSNEQMMALLIVADQYKLNPFTKELYAFPDKNNGIVPVVGVDGWARIINEHTQFDGLEFNEPEGNGEAPPAWIECVIYRKDRQHATTVREYMAECKRGTGPWGSHPRRMLRHKALIQCARLAFGFVGIYDDDEAQRIIEGTATAVTDAPAAVKSINAAVTKAKPAERPPMAEPTAADDRPPLDLGSGPAPMQLSYAEVRAKIDKAGKAKNADAMAEAEDAISLAPVQFGEELRGIAAEWKAKF